MKKFIQVFERYEEEYNNLFLFLFLGELPL